MSKLDQALDGFCRGEIELDGLLGGFREAIEQDPATAPHALGEIAALIEQGRLPPQFLGLFEQAAAASGADTTPSSSGAEDDLDQTRIDLPTPPSSEPKVPQAPEIPEEPESEAIAEALAKLDRAGATPTPAAVSAESADTARARQEDGAAAKQAQAQQGTPHVPPKRSRLGELARDYADGRLGRTSYLHARKRILDALERQADPEDRFEPANPERGANNPGHRGRVERSAPSLDDMVERLAELDRREHRLPVRELTLVAATVALTLLAVALVYWLL